MGNKQYNPSQSDYLLLDNDVLYPSNIIPVHVWKIRCHTEQKDIYYVHEQCPRNCPYGKNHEIDVVISRMKPCDMVMDKYKGKII